MRLNFAYIVAALLASAASVHAAPLTATGSTGSDLRIRGSDVVETQNPGLVNVTFMSLSAGEKFGLPSLHLHSGEEIEKRVKTAIAKQFSVPLDDIQFKNEYKNEYAVEPIGPSEILVLAKHKNERLGTLFSINRKSVASVVK